MAANRRMREVRAANEAAVIKAGKEEETEQLGQ
jgi:hypothetical protein